MLTCFCNTFRNMWIIHVYIICSYWEQNIWLHLYHVSNGEYTTLQLRYKTIRAYHAKWKCSNHIYIYIYLFYLPVHCSVRCKGAVIRIMGVTSFMKINYCFYIPISSSSHGQRNPSPSWKTFFKYKIMFYFTKLCKYVLVWYTKQNVN